MLWNIAPRIRVCEKPKNPHYVPHSSTSFQSCHCQQNHPSRITKLKAGARKRTRWFAEVLARSTAFLMRMDIAYLSNRSNPPYQSPLCNKDLHQENPISAVQVNIRRKNNAVCRWADLEAYHRMPITCTWLPIRCNCATPKLAWPNRISRKYVEVARLQSAPHSSEFQIWNMTYLHSLAFGEHKKMISCSKKADS